MRRAVKVLMLLLVFAQAGGLSLLSAADTCAADPCEDDAGGRDCPPVCPTCTCAARPQGVPVAAAVALIYSPPIAAPLFGEPADMPPDPGAAEILHIPKTHLVTV